MVMSAYEQGVKWGSCREALEERRKLGPNATQADWWLVCPRGDWLIWQLQWLSTTECNSVRLVIQQTTERTTARAVRRGQRALQNVTASWAAEWRQWARRWLSGENRTEAAARVAALGVAAARMAALGAADWEAATMTVVWSATLAAADGANWPTSSMAWAAESAMFVSTKGNKIKMTASMRERRRQTREIRAEIPEWPGTSAK